MATDVEDELDLDEEERKKKPDQPIGNPIVGPQPTPDQLATANSYPSEAALKATSIGKPIQPPQPNVSSANILPGVDTGQSSAVPPAMPPPDMGPTPPPGVSPISGVGPLSPAQPTSPRTPRPQYHGLNRALDAIGQLTWPGQVIERGADIGTEGWRQKSADEERQIKEGEQSRQAAALTGETEARTGLATAQAGEAEARGKAAEAGMHNVVVTINGVQYQVPAKDAEKLIGIGVTGETRENVANINAAAKTANVRQPIRVMGDRTYERTVDGKGKETWSDIGPAPARAESGNYSPINDETGATVGWVNPKSGHMVRVNEIPGMGGGAGDVAPGGAIPPKPTTMSRDMGSTASVVSEQVPRIMQEIDKVAPQIGPFAGRFDRAYVNRLGANDPDFAKLDQDLDLFASGVARAHFGARGAATATLAFKKNLTEAQSVDDLKARINTSDEWMKAYAVKGGAATAGGGGAGASPTPTSGPKKFGDFIRNK
jgi:hypothetical protein